jgi:hypothetical protein
MKTGQSRFHAFTLYLSCTLSNLEPTAVCNYGSVPVKMEGCEDMHFKQYAIIEFLTVEKIPPIDIHCHMQVVCGDKCVDVSTDIGYSSLSKKLGKQVCVTRVGEARTEFRKLLNFGQSALKLEGIMWKNDYAKW